MKLILCLAVLSASVCAETQKISTEDARKILHENLTDAKDMQEYLGQIADMMPMIQPTSLSKEELLQIFHNDFVEREDLYLEQIASEVNPSNVENVMQLISNPLYLNNREALGKANSKCFMMLFEKAKEVALQHPVDPVTTEVVHAIVELQKDNFDKVISSSRYVIVDVYADWCNPCKMLAPILQELSNELGDHFTFAKVNATEENQELFTSLDVKMLPTLILYKDGKEITRTSGYKSKADLAALIRDEFFKKEVTN